MLPAIRAFVAKSPILAAGLAALVGAAVVYGGISLVGGSKTVQAGNASSSADGDAGQAPPTPVTDTLTKDSAAALVVAFWSANCTPSTVAFGNEADFPILDAWEQELARSGGYTLASSAPLVSGYTAQDVLTYVNHVNGDTTATMTVTINKYAQLYYRRRDFIGCLLAPASADVLDTTIDPSGKTATVTYRLGPAVRTGFASDMLGKAAPATVPVFNAATQWPAWTSEHTAFLQKLDATGWRVNSTR
jgi:hypothetical protein